MQVGDKVKIIAATNCQDKALIGEVCTVKKVGTNWVYLNENNYTWEKSELKLIQDSTIREGDLVVISNGYSFDGEIGRVTQAHPNAVQVKRIHADDPHEWWCSDIKKLKKVYPIPFNTIKVNDIFKTKEGKRLVLATSGNLVGLSACDDFHTFGAWFTESQMDHQGFYIEGQLKQVTKAEIAEKFNIPVGELVITD